MALGPAALVWSVNLGKSKLSHPLKAYGYKTSWWELTMYIFTIPQEDFAVKESLRITSLSKIIPLVPFLASD